MKARTKRLRADYEKIKKGLRHHPVISIEGVSGKPPERYRISYSLRSLAENAEGELVERHEHTAEVYLTLAYPRRAPQCRMLTPMFHPNIAPHAICIGDHWAAGESLLDLIVRIGQMLAFQSYNTQSPLNGAAARWVEDFPEKLPTDSRDLTPESWGVDTRRQPAENQCQNCRAADVPLTECSGGHRVCADCLVECGHCGDTFCVLCDLNSCTVCGTMLCQDCSAPCPQCSATLCPSHLGACDFCSTRGCPDCAVECAKCNRTGCLEHARQCAECGQILCVECAQKCANCRKLVCSEHARECLSCGAASCPDCAVQCAECGGWLCLEHLARCEACGALLCEDHATLCSRCNKTVCHEHGKPAAEVCVECAGNPAPQQPARPAKVRFDCSSCGRKLKAPANSLGGRVRCPHCRSVIEVVRH